MYPLAIPEKYDVNNLENLSHRFSVVYLWTYISWDSRENSGSHPGVDIRPVSPNQDVFAVLDAKVFKAWEDAAYGKYVFLEHAWVPHPDDLSKTTTLYSCYQHLDRVDVVTWQMVKEWDIIGTTWNTWISFWEHLHFQIDRQEAPFHSYWPYTGTEVRAAWLWFSEGVNVWMWKEKAKMYTVNPLVYLDSVAKKSGNNSVSTWLDNDLFWKLEDMLLSDTQTTPTLHTQKMPDISIPVKEEILQNPKDILLASLHNEPILTGEYNNFSNFQDLDRDDEIFEFVQELTKKWILSGFWDNTFRPNNSITRIELLKMILLLKNISLSNDETTYFQDIFQNSWHKKYVNTWLERWILTQKNTHFYPNNYISRVEALKMILTLYVWDVEEKYSQNFVDIPFDAWYKKYVEYAIEKWFFEKGSHFYPDNFITRREVVKILSKI